MHTLQRWLLTGFLFGFLGAIGVSCGGAPTCNSTTCATGCCDAMGRCQSASSSFCGTGGAMCQQCALGQFCSLGVCVGGTGGGTAQGGGAGGGMGGGATGGGSGGGATGGGMGGGATGGGS
ncbi:MAG: hypothetical protein AB1938_27700, partial [Myxococcota bacterium]